MKKLITLTGILLVFILCTANSFGQVLYLSATDGNWSSASTWLVSTDGGTTWLPASSPPSGSEDITVDDSVNVDVGVNITGYVTLSDPGEIEVGAGSLTFENGSTYEHAMNGGEIPTSTWQNGSTCLITGATSNSPGNANQNFYNFIWDCSAQSSNLNLSWSGITIGGDVICENTNGSNQFRFTNNSSYTDSITIMGNVVVNSGVLTSTGSSGPQNYLLIVQGDIIVTGGTFGLSRGSGGVATWRLFGDLNVSNAELRTSNSDSRFVFAAADTQDIALQSVNYTSSWDYEIQSSSIVRIVDGPDPYDLEVEQNFINGGDIIADGMVHFLNGANYQHTVNSGTVPVAVWETGSTATFTGITSQAPANRNQSYYNIVWDCPGQISNLNMGFDEVTIGGDITIVSTGASNRWYLCSPPGGDTATVTIDGNIIQTGGQFSSNGSGNAAFIEITVNGDITVTGGNFSVSRGSQGGTGTTKWYLHGTNFSMSDATTQNSNPTGAKFIFSGTTPQYLTLTNVNFNGGFPVEVAPDAILFAGESEIEGSGDFILNDNATLGSGNEGGIDSTLQMSGTITLSSNASYAFNGTVPQVTGSMLPGSMNSLTVDNASGVTLSHDIGVNGFLTISNGDLHLNGHYITLEYSGTLVETAGNTITDPSGGISAYATLNAPSGVNVGGLGLMFTSTDNLGDVEVYRFHSVGTGGGNEGIQRQYRISFLLEKNKHLKSDQTAENPSLASTLRFYYDESELNGISESNLTLFNSLTGLDNSWTQMGGTVNTSENYIELTNVSDYSLFWTMADINAPIPVELISFAVVPNDMRVTLNWKTASETNNAGWNIQRTKIIEGQEKNWQKIGFVDGSGTTTSEKEYSFTDNNLSSGRYQYRLQQVDYNGKFTYSDAVEVEVTLIPDEFSLYQNYPNPFNPSTTIKFDVPSSSFVNLSIFNAIGEKVVTLVNEQREAGVHFVVFDASNLSSGIYIYRLTAENNVFIKKMILIR